MITMQKRRIIFMFLFVFVFLFSVFSVYAQNENVINLDQNNDGKFTNTDIRFWIEGYEINLVDARSLLYIIDFVPSDGQVKCTEDFCMDVPYYTDDEIEIELFRRFVTVAIGGELSNETINLDDTSAISGENYNSIFNSFLSYFDNFGVTGFQTQTGYDPEQYLKENKEISKQKILDKGVKEKLADDFLNRMNKITRENYPQKDPKTMSDAEYKAFEKMIADKVAQSYGFKDADSLFSAKSIWSAIKSPLLAKDLDNIKTALSGVTAEQGIKILDALGKVMEAEAQANKNNADVANVPSPKSAQGAYGKDEKKEKGKMRIAPKK